jgi:SAM-dependent methyltransferase
VADILRPSAEQALAAWAERVRGNRDQAERLREAPERTDFYAPVAGAFKADPHRTDEPALDFLRDLVVPGETWLDVGAGGGRYALPLALLARNVIAVDTSESMLTVLTESMEETGIHNIRIARGRWPLAERPTADAALIAHVGYDIEDLGSFLDALEESAERLCVAILMARAPSAAAEPAWPLVHGEERIPLPGLPEFLAVLLARGRLFEVRLTTRPPMHYHSRDVAMGFLRQQLFIEPGGAKDKRLEELAETLVTEQRSGFSVAREPTPVGVVSWAPR